MSDPLLLFPHIYRTGGTTLRRILFRQYGRSRVLRVSVPGQDPDALRAQIRAARWDGVRVLTAHLGFGAHELVDRPCAYFTMLREPVSRVVSVFDRRLLDPALAALELDNGQTRMLSGREVPFGGVTRRMLEEAKRNLAGFAAFGLTERYDESLVLFQKRFGWRLPLYTREHVRRNKARLAESVLDRVRSVNELDIELYEYAKGLFGEVRDGDLRRFRRWNRPYSTAYAMLRPVIRAIMPTS